MSEPNSKKPNLDNVSKKFLEELKNTSNTPIYEMQPDDARNFLLTLQKKYYTTIDANIEDINIFSLTSGDINVRLVRPKDKTNEILPLILYCHGGGWVIGDAEAYDMTIKTIADNTDSVVAFVNYSRAPEFKYPEAINQIYAVLKHLYENGSDYKIDTNHIAIVGDSAGGNMASAITIKNKIEKGPKITFQALIYPVIDAEMDSDSYKDFKNGPWLSKDAMEWFWNSYLSDKEQKKDIFVSPINADIETLKDLPPALIITAENDVLRDEGEAYARKLIEAGVDTACVRINNTFHDFMMLNGLRNSKATKAGFKLLCQFLKYSLHENTYKS